MSIYCEARRDTDLNCEEWPSPEEQIQKAREFLTGNNKKAFKLISRQYIIPSAQLEHEDPIITNELREYGRLMTYVPERKFVVRYVNFYDNVHVNVFEWVIKESEFSL